ncbi:MAG: hypothetical protein RBU37_24405 [Myxococcota bacterium]|jgi:hypothetical protein|nr:hypothetical protein [Myxococcota bacterium]
MCDSLSRAFNDIAVPSEEPDAKQRRAAAAALLLHTLQEIVERSPLRGYPQSFKEEAIQQVLLKLLQRPQREQRYADAQVRSFLRRGLKWALEDLSNAERASLRAEPLDDEQAAPELPSQSIAAADPGIKLDLERLGRYLEQMGQAQRMTPGRVQALDDLLARASHGWAWEELAAVVCPRCQLGRLQRAQGAQDGVCALRCSRRHRD